MNDAMNTVRIRTLAKRDLKPLAKLYSALYPDEEVARAQYYFTLSLNKKKAKQAFHYLRYYVADCQGKAVGVIGEYNWVAHPPAVRWLGYFAVKPDCQRQGLGQRLFQTMEQRAIQAGVSVYCLETSSRPEEAAANRFYETQGFTLGGTIPGFWGDYDQKYYYKVLTSQG